jgi:hypothetical protein
MSQYIIDTNDPTTEQTFQAYKAAQRDVLSQVATAYQAVSVALSMYAALGTRLTGGDLAKVAGYHGDASKGLLDSETALIAHLRAALAYIDGMQTARPGLFPGVPVAVVEPIVEEPIIEEPVTGVTP